MAVRIFVAGGTLDKVHDPIKERLVFRKSSVPVMLKLGRNRGNAVVEELMLMDSLEMRYRHRMKILEKCRSCRETRVVVTHGTSTMAKTAKVLGENLKGKTVVLTGAMVPYSIKGSDAMFNLAYALGAVHSLPAGVYIVMNGKILQWDNARKIPRSGEFEKVR